MEKGRGRLKNTLHWESEADIMNEKDLVTTGQEIPENSWNILSPPGRFQACVTQVKHIT